ncbi:MAG TPA: hypothetical protein ENN68_09070 [Methanomicrobia archaeon]|nr:hypothetical protein [Methanomicrobia archaeon]
MVKLTNEEIKWLIIRAGSGFFTVKKAAAVYGVTECRMQQLIKMHREDGGVFEIGFKEAAEDPPDS